MQSLDEFKQPDYIGTFSSVSVIRTENEAIFNDSLTALTNHLYDSTVKSSIRKVRFENRIPDLPSGTLARLSNELVEIIARSEKDKTIRNLNSPLVLDSVAALSSGRYSMCLVNYGATRTPGNFAGYKTEKSLILAAAVTGALIGGVAGAVAGKGVAMRFTTYKNVTDGVHSYLLVYDKKEKRVCFLRKQFFASDKANNKPFNSARINKQISIIFKEYLFSN